MITMIMQITSIIITIMILTTVAVDAMGPYRTPSGL
jgi:hypothetical protein